VEGVPDAIHWAWRTPNVSSWHKSDIPDALTNVRLQGNSGHAMVGPRRPFLTLSGHRQSACHAITD